MFVRSGKVPEIEGHSNIMYTCHFYAATHGKFLRNRCDYLYFNGRAEEAIHFYCQAIGAEKLFLMRFKESPDQSMVPPGMGDKIMHAEFRVGTSTLMASDGMCDESQPASFSGISMSILTQNASQAEAAFAALSDGGQVQMPLTETFFSPRFGMVADRFAVSWMVLVQPPDEG